MIIGTTTSLEEARSLWWMVSFAAMVLSIAVLPVAAASAWNGRQRNLGFLGGIDSFWTLRLFPQRTLAVGLTLTVCYLLDRREYRKESPDAIYEDIEDCAPLSLHGRVNLLFLAGVVAAVLASQPLSLKYGASYSCPCS